MEPGNDSAKLFPVWKELVKVIDTWEYGTFHPHEEIARIIDTEPKTPNYYAAIKRAREVLVEHGKLLETMVDKGYFVTEVDRYNEVTFKDIKKSKEFLERSLIKSQFAPVEKMDESQRKRHDLFIVKQVGMLNMVAPAYTEITKVILPAPMRFRIKENKPKRDMEE